VSVHIWAILRAFYYVFSNFNVNPNVSLAAHCGMPDDLLDQGQKEIVYNTGNIV